MFVSVHKIQINSWQTSPALFLHLSLHLSLFCCLISCLQGANQSWIYVVMLIQSIQESHNSLLDGLSHVLNNHDLCKLVTPANKLLLEHQTCAHPVIFDYPVQVNFINLKLFLFWFLSSVHQIGYFQIKAWKLWQTKHKFVFMC